MPLFVLMMTQDMFSTTMNVQERSTQQNKLATWDFHQRLSNGRWHTLATCGCHLPGPPLSDQSNAYQKVPFHLKKNENDKIILFLALVNMS